MNRTACGALVAMKSTSFVSAREYIPADGVLAGQLQDLEIVCSEIITCCKLNLLVVSCYRPPDADINWVMKFHNFLDLVNDLYDNMIISGDMNFPNISWDSLSSVGGVNEEAFVDTLNDHYLSQVNRLGTRG